MMTRNNVLIAGSGLAYPIKRGVTDRGHYLNQSLSLLKDTFPLEADFLQKLHQTLLYLCGAEVYIRLMEATVDAASGLWKQKVVAGISETARILNGFENAPTTIIIASPLYDAAGEYIFNRLQEDYRIGLLNMEAGITGSKFHSLEILNPE
jgi:hypothetical protein